MKAANVKIALYGHDNEGNPEYRVMISERRREYNCDPSFFPDKLKDNSFSEGSRFAKKKNKFPYEIALMHAVRAAGILNDNSIETTIENEKTSSDPVNYETFVNNVWDGTILATRMNNTKT